MRPLTLCVVSAFAVVLAGCPSDESICQSGVDQVCERSFECQPDAVKNSDPFKAAFGTSVDDCKTKLYANPLAPQGVQGIACKDVDSDQKLCSNLGITDSTDFDVNKASECKDLRADMSCEDYLAQLQDPAKSPQVCKERCN